MYAGRKVEEATVDELFERPLHPYTRRPDRRDADPRRRRAPQRLADIPGMVPPLNALPAGLRLRAALPARDGPLPAARRPALAEPAPGRLVACFAAEKVLTMSLLSLRDVHVRFNTAARRVRAVTASASISPSARRWGWWANRAAASPRSARRSCGWCRSASGAIVVDGVDIAPLAAAPHSRAMRRKVQMIFQDPYGSLNPRSTVGRIGRPAAW